MAHSYNEHNPEREEPRTNTPEQETQEPRAAGDNEENGKQAGRASARQNKREPRDIHAEGAAPKPSRKRKQEPREDEAGEQVESPVNGGNILRLPLRETSGREADAVAEQDDADQDNDSTVHELEAQGFTPDEAIRLIHVSDRVATSREAREAEAELRRLRFTRWLVERGVLDEFSA